MIHAICLGWFNALVRVACGAGILGTLKITGLLYDSLVFLELGCLNADFYFSYNDGLGERNSGAGSVPR